VVSPGDWFVSSIFSIYTQGKLKMESEVSLPVCAGWSELLFSPWAMPIYVSYIFPFPVFIVEMQQITLFGEFTKHLSPQCYYFSHEITVHVTHLITVFLIYCPISI
jgi:hypothetical protein